MGRGSTWIDHIPWLSQLGTVYTYDAPWHRGRGIIDSHQVTTEYFVEDLIAAVKQLEQPIRLIGHSMGALHSWCLAALCPQLVSAIIIEDMAPDFRGQTTAAWEPWLKALPIEFSCRSAIDEIFGPIVGRYFSAAFDRTATGWKLHGYPEKWIDIAAQWGRHDYWGYWKAVQIPVLLLEAENSITPVGHMKIMADMNNYSCYQRIRGVGHLIHDEAPRLYRSVVTRFLRSLT